MVIYTGAFRLPSNDAAAKRVRLIAKNLNDFGEEVEFISWGVGNPGLVDGNRYDCSGDLDRKSKFIVSKVLNNLLMGWRALLKLAVRLKESKVDKVIVYNPSFFFSIAVHLLSKKYKFKLILDITEWYESEHLVGGKYGLASAENWLRMNVSNKLYRNCIAITRYLGDFYRKKSRVIVIPAMVDLDETAELRRRSSEEIQIIYAGNLAKKDSLVVVAKAVKELKAHGKKVSLVVYGPSETEIVNQLGELAEHTIIKGRVNSEDVKLAFKKADFSVVIRERKRYAYAGFPTKASESLAHGVPIITNAVGDLGNYCTEHNAILINEADNPVENICESLLRLDGQQLHSMKEAAISTAKTKLTRDLYLPELEKFWHRI